MRIYVASSWRNVVQPAVVSMLRGAGHEVYDFRNPHEGNTGFAWSQIDTAWQSWTPAQLRKALDHPIARQGFALDMSALALCDACVLVMPSGRSAHLEAGFAIGASKPTAVFLAEGEPELMYRMAARLCFTLREIAEWVREVHP